MPFIDTWEELLMCHRVGPQSSTWNLRNGEELKERKKCAYGRQTKVRIYVSLEGGMASGVSSSGSVKPAERAVVSLRQVQARRV